MVDPAALQRDIAALRVRSNRILFATAVIAVLAGFGVRSALDDVEGLANMAQSNALTALGQANTASSHAHQASTTAQQALLQAGGGTNQGRGLPVMPTFQPVVRSGEVTEVTGTAPASVGDTCTVTVISRNGGNDLNCQASVRCGAATIYGGGTVGYLVCGIEDGQPTFGRDEETRGDPMLELNLAGDTVVVSDEPEPKYSVTIALDKIGQH